MNIETTALSMRKRLEEVNGDILELYKDESLESLLGDLGPEDKREGPKENGSKWPNSKPLLLFEDKMCGGF